MPVVIKFLIEKNRKVMRMSERFPGIDWYCDRCNACLNDQSGFDDHHYVWKCTGCGHKNSISADDIYESEEDLNFLSRLWKVI